MKKYNNLENSEFTQEIDIYEPTDPAHADVLNIPVKQIYENTIVNKQTKVDKEEGKCLSDNNYTDAEKSKLAAVEEGAQKNAVLGIKGNTESEYRTGNVNLTPGNIGAAASNHQHNNYAAVSHNHDNEYAAKTHTHSNYAAASHNHDSAYAAKAHTHSEYAASGHNHDSVYAKTAHTHSPLSMGVRSGTTIPSSSLGNNGDIYFQYVL